MAPPRPHVEATYRIIPLQDGTFGVEVSIPDTFPTMVTSFATELASEDWIARHKRDLAQRSLPRRPWRERVGQKN
jgi:hypothetical protein